MEKRRIVWKIPIFLKTNTKYHIVTFLLFYLSDNDAALCSFSAVPLAAVVAVTKQASSSSKFYILHISYCPLKK